MSPKRICVVLATWTALWAALWACPTRSQADGITFDSASRNAYAEVRSDATGSILDDELLTGTGTGLLTQHAEASYINTSGPSPTESSADGYQDTSLVILAESIAFTGSVSGSWIRGGAAGERLDGYGYAECVLHPGRVRLVRPRRHVLGNGQRWDGLDPRVPLRPYDPCVRVL